jgi:hypothetical protein
MSIIFEIVISVGLVWGLLLAHAFVYDYIERTKLVKDFINSDDKSQSGDDEK